VKIFALAVHTACGPAMGMVTKWEKRCNVVISNQPNITAVSAVSTIWPSVNDGAFSTE
jgi:L-asparagine transporter-like permease